MIDASAFLERAREQGLSWCAGVPCSFLGPLIEASIAADDVDYLGAANEGDAVAMAAGAFIGGRRSAALMQNSGLGNAVSPLTSLTWPFRIPVLLLVTLRGDPDHGDEPQHMLMGAITRALLERMEIPCADLPADVGELDAVLEQADRHLRQERRPFALIVRKGTLTPSPRRESAAPCGPTDTTSALSRTARDHSSPEAPPCRRGDALRCVVEHTAAEGTVVIAATGYTGRELFAIDDRSNHLYMVGSMGCAASLGLGLAHARPDLRVVVVDGDGGALMRMGNLPTVGAHGASNLVHLVLDNGVHDSTGGQPTVSRAISFPDIAAACGYTVFRGGGVDPIAQALADTSRSGPRFVHIPIQPGTPAGLPRPKLAPAAVCERLMRHIARPPSGRAAA